MNTAATPRESTVLIPVLSAEDAVGEWRAKHDPVASAGLPAHITLLYPFLDPDRIDDATLDEIGAFFARIPAFNFHLARTERFGHDVLWLAPEPARPFVEMTEALAGRWRLRPYGGTYAEVVPHLTVGQCDGDGAVLDDAEREIRTALPLFARATDAWLMVESAGGPWVIRSIFRFAGA